MLTLESTSISLLTWTRSTGSCSPPNLVPTKCILSDLAELIFQNCTQCPLTSFRIKSILLHVASKATYLRALASFSILINAPYSFTSCSDILNSLWLLAFAESRPLHMLLHVSIYSLICFCVNSLVAPKIDKHWCFSSLVSELLSALISAPGTWKRLRKLLERVKNIVHLLYSNIWKFVWQKLLYYGIYTEYLQNLFQ